jgi:hypothetical protein
MKNKLLLSLFLLVCTLQLLAQTQATNPIIGTWKMTSQTIIDPDGKSTNRDLSKFTQYKMISPTHFMNVNYNADSLKGGGEYGTYTLQGNKYLESLSWAKVDFAVKADGDKFHMEGTVTYPDGKKWVLKELYERIAEPATTNTSQDVGVWNMTSYQLTRNGKKVDEPGITELLINTPTHFMWVDKKDGKFMNAMYGEYRREANNILTDTPILASFPIDKKEKTDITCAIKGDQMTTSVKITKGDGNIDQWDMVHQRVGKNKAVSVNK